MPPSVVKDKSKSQDKTTPDKMPGKQLPAGPAIDAEVAPSADPSPTPPPTRRRLMDNKEYRLAFSRYHDLNVQANALRAEVDGLAAQLEGKRILNAVGREAMALIGQADDASTSLAEKSERLEVLRHRLDVHLCALQLQEAIVKERKAVAAREVTASYGPAYHAALVRHIQDVVAAARSFTAVANLVEDARAEASDAGCGMELYAYGAVGGIGDFASPANVWLADLVATGTLTGDEPWLADVAIVARRPDGTSCDRPRLGEPNPPPPEKPGAIGAAALAVGAAVQRGLGAVADMADTARRRWMGGPKPSSEPGSRTIRILRDIVNVENEWRRGWCGPWAMPDAANMVRAGLAEWADGAEPAAAVDTVEDGGAGE